MWPEVGIVYPDIFHYQLAAYLVDSDYVAPSGHKFLITPPEETVYSIWIGTNDLGDGAFLTDSQVRGTDLVDYTSCVYDSLRQVYDSGGRLFVLQNVPPLNLLPMYATPEKRGAGFANQTAASYRIMESVVAVNAIFTYRTPFLVKISEEFREAHFALMDTFGLVSSP